MPEDHESDTGDKARSPKGDKRRQQIIAAAGVTGVLLTVILIRKSSNKATQLPVSPAVDPNAIPSSGSYSSGVSLGDFYNLESQVQGLSNQLSAMSSAPAPVGATVPSSSPTNISVTLVPAAWSNNPAQSPPQAPMSPGTVFLQPGDTVPKATGVGQKYNVNGTEFVAG